MSNNWDMNAGKHQTEQLRSRLEKDRKFFRRFYKINDEATRVQAVISVVLLLSAILFLVAYPDTPGIIHFLIACTSITSISTIIRYLLTKKN